MTAIRENGATSGPGVLVTIGYDDLGRRTSLSRGNGAATTYAWDPVSRLAQLSHDLAGTSSDLTLGFSYNPAGQIVSNTRSNDAFAFTGYVNENLSHAANGLNQLTSAGSSTLSYDPRGNLASDGARSFTYSSENLLTARTEGIWTAPFVYDPLNRFSHSGDNRFLTYQGELIGEYQVNALAGRYVHGPGADEPLVLLTSGGTRYWVHADERGSNIASSNPTGAVHLSNRYDEFGRQTVGYHRFRFTGQIILTQDIVYYKARIYDRALGRFMQADPIGYGDGMNLYAYVRNDPVNLTDPSGLCYYTYTGLYAVRSWGEEPLGAEPGSVKSHGCGGGFGGPQRFMLDTPLEGGFGAGSPATEGPQDDETPCPISDSRIAIAYRGARNSAFAMFNGSREIGYAIFRSDETGALHTSFTVGEDGRIPRMTLIRPGQTLALTGHIHNNEVGSQGFFGLGGWAHRGPSALDRTVRSHFPSVTFVLHENVAGKWKDRCY